MQLSQQATETLRKLSTDFEQYARVALKVRSKAGRIEPLVLNQAQKFIHDRLESQRAKTGKVRALILKGRQQGCSTYVEGRYFWRTVFSKGFRTFILTHEDAATANLFDMAQRYLDCLPDALKPSVDSLNAKELTFKALDSGYKVGTAGNKATGRSSTIQLFHGSEVAYWPNAAEHAAGILQAVPDVAGTEVILESTAYGIGNFFHEQWQKAESGDGAYIAIFVPWYWQCEYTAPSHGEIKTAEEMDYQSAYGLTDQQLAWRREKISQLGDSRFKQEYPANAAEAFQTSGDSLIKPETIVRARKCKQAEPNGPLLIGVDPARFGDDNTAICRRRGRVVPSIDSYHGKDTMEVVGLVVKIINAESPGRVFVDVGGLGAGVVDRLRELGYGQIVEAVNFGEKPLDADKYRNRRAECWGKLADWLSEPPVQIPDDDSLHGDLVAPGYKYDSNTRLLIESKEDMKKRGLASPDKGDALALTFATDFNPSAAVADPYRAFRRTG
jgi:hypothetical protein